jgi:hypothetical protein
MKPPEAWGFQKKNGLADGVEEVEEEGWIVVVTGMVACCRGDVVGRWVCGLYVSCRDSSVVLEGVRRMLNFGK